MSGFAAVGGVVNYDMAEYNAAIKFKANTTVFSQNGVVAKADIGGRLEPAA